MIYSSFVSDKNTLHIASICLSILIKTNQSWKIVHQLLSLGEEKIIRLLQEREKTQNAEHRYKNFPDILFYEISKVNNDDIKNTEQLLFKVFAEGWKIALYNSEFYPLQWVYLKNQAPPLFFVKGTLKNNTHTGVAVVGTTQPTEKCGKITEELVKYIVHSGGYVISGGAQGVDQIGHDTAIQSGGATQVILPCGIFHYPIPLYWKEALECNKIQIISPWLPSAKWSSQQAVRRNLFIASLAQIGCILQPSHEGGSLRVARYLLSHNLPVFVHEPEYHAKILKHLPQVLPLTDSDGKLNYSALESAMVKVKAIQAKPPEDLFNGSDRSDSSDLSDSTDESDSHLKA